MFLLGNLKIKKKNSIKEEYNKNLTNIILKNRFYIKYPYLIPLFPLNKNILKLKNDKYDINELKKDVLFAEKDIDWMSKGNKNVWDCITIKSKDGTQQPHLEEFDNNLEFKYTEIAEKCNYIKKILEDLNTDIYLVRLLKLAPKSKVSWHTDELVFRQIDKIIRCHIPIQTNNECKMLIGSPQQEPINNNIWKAETILENYLEEGFLYFTNVNALHAVYNASEKERIHLVLDIKPTKEFLNLILNN